ncbi:ATP-dependent DNA ligase [Thalassoglobus neptunius]|uniref:ATP-dependent DNA ligase n=1 Tax=Thalassoglobus neptunius TaxID=1938619 RepID=A0A5C5X867_9PLAN|nr:DNA polymerase ligase N-terminal domain-containing protein [Thalassoglobus neptunius]TWT59028.1 ATP-dependent DNA ligase [Thalassoglobus neptunius]
MARFAILRHDWPFLHWDFLIESENVLLTWRLATEPFIGAEIAAEQLAPHRLIYLDYEGPVSGGRGEVTNWDRGELVDFRKIGQDYNLKIAGSKISGPVEIRKTPESASESEFVVVFGKNGNLTEAKR